MCYMLKWKLIFKKQSREKRSLESGMPEYGLTLLQNCCSFPHAALVTDLAHHTPSFSLTDTLLYTTPHRAPTWLSVLLLFHPVKYL